jgi:hypothetical protein
MPAERMPMRRVREVLRLRTAGVGLARRVGVAPSTVRLTLKRLASAGLSWPLPAEMTDSALEAHCSLRSAASKVIAVAPSPKDATVITVCRAVNSHRSTAAAARSGSTSKAGFRVRHRLEERDALYQTGQDAASHKSRRDQGTTVAICRHRHIPRMRAAISTRTPGSRLLPPIQVQPPARSSVRRAQAARRE